MRLRGPAAGGDEEGHPVRRQVEPTHLDHTASRVAFGHRGFQAMYPSNAGFLVSFTSPVPSRFITYTSTFPSRSLSKASFEPSGDQAGAPSYAGLFVSRVTPEPSAFIT